jgi:hypothetical protein
VEEVGAEIDRAAVVVAGDVADRVDHAHKA